MARSTSNEIARYLQWRAQEWVRSGRKANELAKLARVSTAQVSELLNHGIGAGWKTAEGLGRAFGLTMGEVITEAAAWARDQPPPSLAAPRADPEARRRLAAQIALEDGVSQEAVDSVLAEPHEDRSTLWWALRMRRRDLDLADARQADPGESGKRPAPAALRRRKS